jgi:hypothetical protein
MIATIIISITVLILVTLFYLYSKFTVNLENDFVKMKNYVNNTNYNRKNIAIVTLETRESNMLSLHNKNVREYCELYGYTYIFRNSYENVLKLPIYWQKLQLVKDILENHNFEYVFWFDSDTLIIDDTICLESILDEHSSIYIGNDFSNNSTLCAGVFAIKNNHIGLDFIQDCIETYVNNNDCKDNFGNYFLGGDWAGVCYEQGMMNKLIKTKYVNYVKLFENHMVLNNYTPNTNCFILHLYVGSKKNREDPRSTVFKNIINDNRCFHNRLSQLIYIIRYKVL